MTIQGARKCGSDATK